MKLRATSFLLALDAAVLFLLGSLFTVFPGYVLFAFGFPDLPPGVAFIVAIWGCFFISMAIGYWKAADDPVCNLGWVQVGIARGVLECGVGVVYMVRGLVSFRQAGMGVILAGLFAIAYLIFYPRAKADPA